ncbi:MAG TPA: exosortase/archaeosortase family protein [Chthoniobacterales bacterium]|nr:exosortase/archaeosortase family protein [Chthoniobacterales bacterium]
MALRSTFGLILPGILWFWVFAHLRTEWSLNSQYNYGWAVPFLGGVIFYFRWQQRPTPSPERIAPIAITVPAALLLLFLFPIRLIEEANPDWRLLSWVFALDVTCLTLLWMLLSGGVKWLRHFAFPICFPLVAVPWPVQVENGVVQAMMRGVASVAVEIAGWVGIGAYQLGNVIQLRNGFVGVDEACSGVKTLQAGIMVALVLGELVRLRPGKRIGLLLIGCGWVFLCNVVRATILVFVAAWSGLDALGRWHDLIGTAALLAGMAGLLVLAWRWKSELGIGDPREARPRPSFVPFPFQWIGLVWLFVVFAGTEFWYRSHESALVEKPRWHVAATADAMAKPVAIPESTRVMLRYDQAVSAQWETSPGVRWWMFFARWTPGRAALQLVRSHSPEICLPAIGRTFRAPRPSVTVPLGDVVLDFRAYEFEQNGQPLFVFVCIQEDKSAAADARSSEWSVRGRLYAALQGKRNLGQRLLELAVVGVSDFEQASAALMETAGALVRRGDFTG